MRRRALLAASVGINSYAYELIITPDWYYEFGEYFSDHYDDYSEVFNLAKKMCMETGVYIPNKEIYDLSVVPSEFNIIVEGRRVCYIAYNPVYDSIYGSFEEVENLGDIFIDLFPEYLCLTKSL